MGLRIPQTNGKSPFMLYPAAQVYVRINSITQYRKCRIVNVQPELDLAVLRIEKDSSRSDKASFEPFQALKFGSSSNLLVGQDLIAIGNPFGLDNTVTTGVVSALNREVRTDWRDPVIRNCIQTDCAINPGNSGGPLLSRLGQVVGINTAVIRNSAGIGFAVPSDVVEPAVMDMIRKDMQQERAWLGVAILRQNLTINWISVVQRNSPAADAGMRGISISGDGGSVRYGDAIVAVGGRIVSTYKELQAELDRCVPGEQLAVTLQDAHGERRVVYLTLGERPR
jgi:S1-C subfamily serine protease